ncbi:MULTISPECIES: hypothetical protein [unclassified Bradyrhizobium]|jgi:hypothetical protein|uniref:hypothetical protein n=1 Tax=unclassified Bradyrhizobium TaxID=2631580 RepID=UPI002306653A|nr:MULTISPECIES: hypothetical protein [unclassified Bradyrhizobium]MDA9410661.1 hypothetical protein [Bradyrhizobium sp. CCBAU 45384]MDA9444981.1 hypothetical protein [Bradyrhizobium sp. CCBAU 51745]
MSVVAPSTSQISPANERLYHQSALIGDWKGTWAGNNQPVGFKVVNIRGNRAQVEYTHNGHTERGFGEVQGTLINFGGVTVGTKDGKNMVLLFSFGGSGKQTATLEKQAPPASDSRLMGSWGGYSSDIGKSASFKVLSVNGNEAQVSVTTEGITRQGTGIVYKNVIMFGQAQIATDDGQNGKITYQVGTKSFMVPVTKYPPADSSSSVDRTA